MIHDHDRVAPFAVGSYYTADCLVEWLQTLPSRAPSKFVEILHDDLRLRVSLGKIWQVLAGRARWLDSCVEFEVAPTGLYLVISWRHRYGGGHVRLRDQDTIYRWSEAKDEWQPRELPPASIVAVVALRS